MGVLTIHRNKNGECIFQNKPIDVPSIRSHKQSGQTIYFKNPPYIIGRMAVVGEKESKGPLGKYFRKVEVDAKLGEKDFEHAEIDMMEEAINGAVGDAGIQMNDLDLLISGDLLNQITTSNYVARDLGIPFLGVYSACSTMTESLAIAATLIDGGHYQKIACATASHFATAERQYRYPLEYGCQKPPYSQWTVTGAGCSILGREGKGARIPMAILGKVVDFGINDLNNMGAAMAPAAMDTLYTFLKENTMQPDDFDLIITGDLGKLGSDILRDLMAEKGYPLGQNYIDCGSLIFALEQNCYQGGSGTACSATVVNSFILDKMESKEYNKVLYLATGALMSPQSCNQGETIPCICHGVVIENNEVQ